MADKPQRLWVFKHTVDPLQGIQDRQIIERLKTIKTVTIHWPDGCNSLVDVLIGYGSSRLMPDEGYLALNDATTIWVVNKEPDSNTIWVEIRNTDSINEHTISVVVNYEEAG